ncbi:glutathione peroxidase [Trichodelitschia bisporula]|uniref:Glutathione peroxidase n=1 Tax=Trichodelitschia bisporula TaxID=703511 RepID=A0A6G1HPX8_9PEZI|nr:glutathione peroxidase [Trichodelitschia bisporula]
MSSATKIYDFTPLDKKGKPFDVNQLKGKVVLVVNTASKCGFTPQFAGLEMLYQEMKKKYPGQFTILGFPCNQFGSQDPGSNDEIQTFCQVNYGVTFPVLGKVNVNGSDDVSPLWAWLKAEKPGLLGIQGVKWNFEKFLVGKDGVPKKRYSSMKIPADIKKDIVEELSK